MNIGTDITNIVDFLSNNVSILIVVAVLAVASAVLCALITKLRKFGTDDIIFTAIFGLVFNVFGLLFVFFRKPVWNNLGWIPVLAAWFFIDGNPTLAIILCLIAVLWAVSQHILLDRIKVLEN